MIVFKSITYYSNNNDYEFLMSQRPSLLCSLVHSMWSSTYFGIGGGGSRVDNSIIDDDHVFIELNNVDIVDNNYCQNHHDNGKNVYCHNKMKVLIMHEKYYELWNNTK